VRVVLAGTLNLPVDSVPIAPLLPVQAPLAVQEVAFVVDQVRVLAPGETTVLGAALRVTVGARVTVTATELSVVPPGPVQARKKVVVAVRANMVSPRVSFGPLHPSRAAQLVAPLLDHDSFVASPGLIELGAALKLTAGADGTTTVKECDIVPPAPVQLRV
jgi:hypothetical protein